MEKIILIVILVLALIIAVSSIINTVLLTKYTKQESLVLKVIKICAIVICAVGLLFAVVFLASDSGETKNETPTQETEDVALSEAGFNEVSLDEYLELIKKEENSIILVARPTCGYCVKFTPILKQAKDEMNLTVNYINTDNITSEEDFAKFEDSLDYFKDEQWGTPLVLIVNNGKVVDSNSGYTELSTIKEFFTKNGFGE